MVKTWLFVLLSVLFVGLLTGQTFDQGKPLIQEIYVPRQLKPAKSVRLSCGTIQGEPPMVFTWSFNNVQIADKDPFQRSNFIVRTADTSSDLIIKSLSVDNIGLYSCSSSNRHGIDTQNVSILFEGDCRFWYQIGSKNFEFKDSVSRCNQLPTYLSLVKPQFVTEPTDQTFRLYEEIALNCSTKGHPAPQTKWLKLNQDGSFFLFWFLPG